MRKNTNNQEQKPENNVDETKKEKNTLSAEYMREVAMAVLNDKVKSFINEHITPAAKRGEFSTRVMLSSDEPEDSEVDEIVNIEKILNEHYGYEIETSAEDYSIDDDEELVYVEISWY